MSSASASPSLLSRLQIRMAGAHGPTPGESFWIGSLDGRVNLPFGSALWGGSPWLPSLGAGGFRVSYQA